MFMLQNKELCSDSLRSFRIQPLCLLLVVERDIKSFVGYTAGRMFLAVTMGISCLYRSEKRISNSAPWQLNPAT